MIFAHHSGSSLPTIRVYALYLFHVAAHVLLKQAFVHDHDNVFKSKAATLVMALIDRRGMAVTNEVASRKFKLLSSCLICFGGLCIYLLSV